MKISAKRLIKFLTAGKVVLQLNLIYTYMYIYVRACVYGWVCKYVYLKIMNIIFLDMG